MTKKPKKIPFAVNRDDSRSLLDQVTDGLREAIVRGYYAPGDVLPSSNELVPILGVSRIITQNALARIAAEGYIASRVGVRSVVRDRNAKQWRGHVVFVYPQGDVDYFPTIFAEELRLGLNRAGYLFTRASVGRALDGGPCDFSLLDAALSRSVDLAVVFDNRAAIFRHLAARKIPYAAVAHCNAAPAGAVGLTRFDYEAAVPHFVSACRSGGIRSAIVLRWDSMMCNAAPALNAAGIVVRTVSVKPDFACGKHFGVEAAGYAGFEKLANSGRLSPETVVFVTDDYLARGALSAMLAAGLRPPEDFRLAVWSNAGIGPYFPRELSRMETDPRADGATAAAAALAYLETGRYPDDTAIRPRWIPGETMASIPPESNRQPSKAIEGNRKDVAP